MKYIPILLAALLLVLGAHAVTKAEPPAGVTQWEYKIVVTSPTDPKDLNAAGGDGWELVAIASTIHYFKRPLKK